MTDECISPLRRRMIEDMTVRNFVTTTQARLHSADQEFAIYLGRSPDTGRSGRMSAATPAASSIERNGRGEPSIGAGSALRFLFEITLDRPEIVRHLPVAREPRKAPVILSPEEVGRMLEAAPGVKYQGGAERRLWGGSAGIRSRCAQGERYRRARE